MSPEFTVLFAVSVPNQRRTGVTIVKVTLEADAVAFADITAVVELVTDAIVVLAGIPEPLIFWPTSLEVKFAVAEVTVADALVVTPSDTERVAVSHNSIPPIVQAGMPVKLTEPTELVIEPPEAPPQIVEVVVSWRAYVEPPVLVTSLPATVAVDGVVVVISARFTGLVART